MVRAGDVRLFLVEICQSQSVYDTEPARQQMGEQSSSYAFSLGTLLNQHSRIHMIAFASPGDMAGSSFLKFCWLHDLGLQRISDYTR